MAASIQSIGDRAAIINDMDLLALMGMLIEKATTSQKRYPALQPFVQEWERAFLNYGPGVIDLQLESIVIDRKSKADLEQLLREIERELLRFGSVIPASCINNLRRAPGVTFTDYATSDVCTTIEKLRLLMG